MRRSVKVLLSLSALAIVIVGGGIFFTLPHWWVRVGFAEVRGPAEAHLRSSTYRSTSGDILFLVPDDVPSEDCYVFSPARNEITIPSCPSQVYSFGIIAFSIDSPIPGVLSSNKLKVETDMNVVINNEVIEFTTLSGRRVRSNRDSF